MLRSRTPAIPSALALIAAVFLLAACTSSGGGSPSATANTTPIATPTATPAATPTPAGGGSSATAAPTAVDPCKLLTAQQVMQVNGISYGAGTRHNLSNGGMQCTWMTASPPSSVVVQVVVAPSITVADEDYAAFQATLHGFTLTNIPNIANDAVIARAPSVVNTGGIYVRNKDTFFDVVYLNGTAPSDDQLTTTAKLILGELP